VTFHDNGNGTATISGKPTVGGVFAITIKADNSVAPVTSQSFTLTVNGPPTITSADHTGFEVGSAGTFTVTTAPGTPAGAITLTKAGNLPDGVTFTDNRNGTATLAGTPANRTSGSYPLTFTASGSASNSTQAFTLIVGTPPQITSASTAFFSSNSMNTFAVTTSGGYPTPPALTETGALPSWLTFRDNGDGTATLSGVPPAGPLVGYSIEIRADNHVAKVTTQNFTLYVWNNTG
jgi:hypothetical protein